MSENNSNGKKDEKQKKEQPASSPSISGFAVYRSSEMGNEDISVPLWLITFTDIMALMLTFFVMLYAMAVPEEEKWEEMSSGFNRGFSKFQSAQLSAGPQDSINIDRLDFSRALDLNYLNALVTEIIAKDDNLKNVVVIPQNDRLILSLPSDLLFESGQAEVGVKGKRAIYALGGPLSRIRNAIEVIGHADPRPIEAQAGKFASNWELSLSRGVNVAAVLETVGYGRNVTVRGLSSARYDELPADMDPDERLSLSRRVDIVIMRGDGNQRILADF